MATINSNKEQEGNNNITDHSVDLMPDFDEKGIPSPEYVKKWIIESDAKQAARGFYPLWPREK